jgi:hypothetical protein
VVSYRPSSLARFGDFKGRLSMQCWQAADNTFKAM